MANIDCILISLHALNLLLLQFIDTCFLVDMKLLLLKWYMSLLCITFYIFIRAEVIRILPHIWRLNFWYDIIITEYAQMIIHIKSVVNSSSFHIKPQLWIFIEVPKLNIITGIQSRKWPPLFQPFPFCWIFWCFTCFDQSTLYNDLRDLIRLICWEIMLQLQGWIII